MHSGLNSTEMGLFKASWVHMTPPHARCMQACSDMCDSLMTVHLKALIQRQSRGQSCHVCAFRKVGSSIMFDCRHARGAYRAECSPCMLCREGRGENASAQDLCCKILLSDAIVLTSLCSQGLQDMTPRDEQLNDLSDKVVGHATEWLCMPKLWQVSAHKLSCGLRSHLEFAESSHPLFPFTCVQDTFCCLSTGSI